MFVLKYEIYLAPLQSMEVPNIIYAGIWCVFKCNIYIFTNKRRVFNYKVVDFLNNDIDNSPVCTLLNAVDDIDDWYKLME